MIESKDLELVVERYEFGIIFTNALAIKEFVDERVKDYEPDKYAGDADAAKKDRAELNKASKELNSKRLELEKNFMKPFDEFKSVINSAVKSINGASSMLDEIVKTKEEEEKAAKLKELEAYFDSKNFKLLPFTRIMDKEWLNKTYKIKEACAVIDLKIAKVYTDIKTIEAFGVDVAVLKPIYLDTLDLGLTISKGNELKAYREKLAREQEERADREKTEKITELKTELAKDAAQEHKADKMSSIAAEALGVDADPVIEYTLRFKGTRAQLLALRQYMLDQGIEYEKL